MVHILLKKIYISNEILRINKFISKNFTTNINKVLISPVLLWKNSFKKNNLDYKIKLK